MNEAPIAPSFYKVGGALPQDVPSYVTRESDSELYKALKAGEFCYVLNCRQMGKSSLMLRTLVKLQAEGWAGIIVDFSAKDSQAALPDRWYNGIINQLNRQFKLLERKDFRLWLKEQNFLSPVERLGEFIETVLLPGVERPIVILIDEIDSTLNLPFTDDFFALIRTCYNKRAENFNYKRLTFALFGVAAPSNLISDTKRTPFNIGKSIDLKGFTLQEARPLTKGLTGKSKHPQMVLQEILYWTQGQPFLTQRLCQLVLDSSFPITSQSEATLIEGIVRSRLIENWESQDHQEHLKTIRKRLIDNEQKAGYLLELYQQIHQQGQIPLNDSIEQSELQLSGLVTKRQGKLSITNPIYREVFNQDWIDQQLGSLRPYSENFRAWVASGCQDESRLLRGQALILAEEWAKNKSLSYQDQEFLAACRNLAIEEENKKAQLKRERHDKEAELERERQAREVAEKANKEAQRRIRIGSIVLGISLLGTIISIGLGYWQIQKTQTQLNEVEYTIDQTHKAIEAVRDLSKWAGELRKKGQLTASEEVLRKAGLSILITNYELKRIFLLAATAEAHGNEQPEKAQEILKKLNLDPLNDNTSQLDTGILNQVKAFAYFQAGKLKDEKYYQDAYEALKASNFDPFNSNVERDILTEKDIEEIYYRLIKSHNIDLNSKIYWGLIISGKNDQNLSNKEEIALSFIEHLLGGLKFALQEDRLKEADRKTTDIMIYIAGQREEGYFTVKSLQNFSCDALRKIDALWYSYPKRRGHFGFRVQKEIWIRNGSPDDLWDTYEKNWKKIYMDVGWKTEESGMEDRGYLSYSNLEGFKDVSTSRRGNLPFGTEDYGFQIKTLTLLFSRAKTCNL